MTSNNPRISRKWWQYIIFFHDWQRFEQLLLIANFAATFVVFGLTYHNSTSSPLSLSALWISLIANCANTISILLVIRKKISSLYLGIVAVICLGYVSWVSQLLGALLLYVCYFFAQILAIYLWKKSSTNKIDIKIRHLQWWMILIIVVVAVVATSGFYFVNKESSFHDWFFLKITNQPTAVVYIFDSSALVANIFVLFLSLLRFRERWVISVIGDLVLLVEWIVNFHSGAVSYVMIITYVTMTISSVYGLYCWYFTNNTKT